MNMARRNGLRTLAGIICIMQIPSHVQEHIETIARHEQEFYAKRSRAEKIGDAVAGFAGNFAFVLIHLAVFAVWMLVNTTQVGPVPHFDPAPFAMLDTVVAIEAILLASFILMRQSASPSVPMNAIILCFKFYCLPRERCSRL